MKKTLLILWAWTISASAMTLDPNEKLITLMATNDLHGSMDNLGMWAAQINAVKKGLANQFGTMRTGTLLLDGGDQFQGTLVSNYDEGVSIFKAMNVLGYDAIVPGNHDYDFGPMGWLEDRVSERTEDKNPRGAFLRIVGQAKFSVLSANTYYKNSFVDFSGAPLEVEAIGCKTNTDADWSKAMRAEFVKPYQIFERAGVRIAVIGIDNDKTSTTTTEVNVSDLCFDNGARAYQRVIAEIKDQADLFVIVMHNGDVPDYDKKKEGPLQYKSEDGSKVVKEIQELGLPIHAVVAGHTHQDNRRWLDGVPFIQSGANGTAFGRIDLVYDTEKKSLVRAKTKMYSSLSVNMKKCPKFNPEFCTTDETTGTILIEGEPLVQDQSLVDIATEARKNIAHIADQVVAVTAKPLQRSRTDESALVDWLTDALRFATNTQIAFMNTGGVRANLSKGNVKYEDLFEVLPFNNRAVNLEPMRGAQLERLLSHSIKTCGKFGALMQSGLKVMFTKNCKDVDFDKDAKLTHVETLGGEVLLDVATGVEHIDPAKVFKIATLDFLISGKSEFGNFTDPSAEFKLNDSGIAREVIVDYLKTHTIDLSVYPDGRWKQTN
ncbi:MAG: 5'-nucleotidase C-terminal domain-containing protein [Xanthomonadaceae bacterium]|nr:5'-nucleotidase C-terminal domain-containing protein [Xanthomonadaceae bacterium]